MLIPQAKNAAQATPEPQKSLVRQALEHKDVTREILGHLSASDAYRLAQTNRQTRRVAHEEVLANIRAPIPSAPAAAPLLNPLWIKNTSRSAHAAAVHKQFQWLGDQLPAATWVALSVITLPTIFLPGVCAALADDYASRILPQKQQARRDRERPTRPNFESIRENAAFTHALLASGALVGASADIDSKYFQYLALPALLAEQQQKQLQTAITKFTLRHQWKQLEAILAVAPITSVLGLNAQQLKSAIHSASRAREPAALRWLTEQGGRVHPNTLQKLMVDAMLRSEHGIADPISANAVENLLAMGATLTPADNVHLETMRWAYKKSNDGDPLFDFQHKLVTAQATSLSNKSTQLLELEKHTANLASLPDVTKVLAEALLLANSTMDRLGILLESIHSATDGPLNQLAAARALLAELSSCAACARQARGVAQRWEAAPKENALPTPVTDPLDNPAPMMAAQGNRLANLGRRAAARGQLAQGHTAAASTNPRAAKSPMHLQARDEDVRGSAKTWAIEAQKVTAVEVFAARKVAWLEHLQGRRHVRRAWADRAHALVDQQDFVELQKLVLPTQGLSFLVTATGVPEITLEAKVKAALWTAVSADDWTHAQAIGRLLRLTAATLPEANAALPSLLLRKMTTAITAGQWADVGVMIKLGAETTYSHISAAHAMLSEAAATGNAETAKAILASNMPQLPDGPAIDWRNLAKVAFKRHGLINHRYSINYNQLRNRMIRDVLILIQANNWGEIQNLSKAGIHFPEQHVQLLKGARSIAKQSGSPEDYALLQSMVKRATIYDP